MNSSNYCITSIWQMRPGIWNLLHAKHLINPTHNMHMPRTILLVRCNVKPPEMHERGGYQDSQAKGPSSKITPMHFVMRDCYEETVVYHWPCIKSSFFCDIAATACHTVDNQERYLQIRWHASVQSQAFSLRRTGAMYHSDPEENLDVTILENKVCFQLRGLVQCELRR